MGGRHFTFTEVHNETPYDVLSMWLYSPILGLGRLHEILRFISVTRSRTVSSTPRTGDQLVARPLRVCPE
jgi:hypothetical protein